MDQLSTAAALAQTNITLVERSESEWNIKSSHNNNFSDGSSHYDGRDLFLARRNSNSFESHDDYSHEFHASNSRRRRSTPLPSGLSALIQAATSQLGQLAEVASLVENFQSTSDSGETSGRPQLEMTRTLEPLHTELPTSAATFAHTTKRCQPEYPPSSSCSRTQRPHHQKQQQQVASEITVPRSYTFPEVLMSFALDPRNVDVITFLPDGKFFAIRSKRFTEELLPTLFDFQTFDEFLEAMNDWGFSIILDPTSTGIAVFRHPHFIKGDWQKCKLIRFGESPTNARLHALPDRRLPLGDESVLNNHSNRCSKNVDASMTHMTQLSERSCTTNPKRRLSLSFTTRRDSLSSISSQKQKVEFSDRPVIDSMNMTHGTNFTSYSQTLVHDAASGDESEFGTCEDAAIMSHVPSGSSSYCNPVNHADDVRSLALAITTENLNLRHQAGAPGSTRNSMVSSKSVLLPDEGIVNEDDSNHANLVDSAVTSATHTIVSDAIATLLRDRNHTKETYLKHEKELSRSMIPGVITISKQLFSSSEEEARHSVSSSLTTIGLFPPSKSDVGIHQEVIKDEKMIEFKPQREELSHQFDSNNTVYPGTTTTTADAPISSVCVSSAPPFCRTSLSSRDVKHNNHLQVISPDIVGTCETVKEND